MAEDSARSRQYAYQQNSNLVLEADRDSRRQRPGDEKATGEVESLAPIINKYQMGDKAQRTQPKSSKRAHDDGPESHEQKKKKKKKSKYGNEGQSSVFLAGEKADILTESAALESYSYKPKNPISKDAYERILSVVAQKLGQQPGEILAGATEEVLEIIKDDTYRDDEKYKETQKLLKNLRSEEFNELVTLGKKITDFKNDEDDENANTDEETANEGDMDKEMGVAIEIDDDDDESISDLDEIRDDDEEEEEEEGVLNNEGQAMRFQEEEKDEDMEDNSQNKKYFMDVQSIDAFWLQREVSKFYQDADVSAKITDDILSILKEAEDLGSCENRLVLLLDYDKFDFIKLLLHNKNKILFCTRLKQAQSESERKSIEEEMLAEPTGEGKSILHQLSQTASADSWMQDRIGAMSSTSREEAKNLRRMQVSEQKKEDEDAPMHLKKDTETKPQRVIDVDSLTFKEGGHFMSNKECHLPEGTWRAQKKGYEEVHVPAVRAKTAIEEEKKRIKIDSLPSWTHKAFAKMESLNRVQSRMYKSSFESSENLLLCAPTGAGKTNVAVLTILHEVAKARNPEDGSIDLDSFKIVYVAPMKALVQEVVMNLSSRLTEAYGIQVRELSGDQNLSREQLFQTQIIVTTPEKWDVITRKSGDDRTYTQLVRLVIIDEIHLLHDTRGPVLESLVARTIRNVETTQQMIRLVGLSATLPNYEDVAAFLRVKPDKGLFYFDSSYRPVPLQQQYIGIMEKKALKRFALMNEICYEKVMEQSKFDNQVLIFVHSRKETAATARALRDLCIENDTLAELLKPQSASSEILQTEVETNVQGDDLKEVLPYGIGIHHAGMKRSDRTLVENLFADGHLQVLCSTSTLAWGVNLPAHTVIIKGTQMYNAEKSDWTELSPLDILQMLGRAGRIQYDTQGEGIIITQHAQLKYYLSLMNQQLPVESQMLSRLADNLNAEIVLGTIQSISQAATWLGYTYLYVRMLRNPTLYGIPVDEIQRDPTLKQRRIDLCHSAATILAKNNLIKYERRTGFFQVTALGRVASHYYIVHDSISTYNEYLKPYMADLEIFRLFSLSNEFKHVVVRAEEKLELMKLLERVPIPVKESISSSTAYGGANTGSSSAKVNVLLQAYISRLKLDGFALLADMVHIHQSAARIFRALFEICLHRGWAVMAEKILNIAKMVDKRMWLSHSPLRQFPQVPETILRKIEKKDIPWDRYADLSPADLGQLINQPKMGKQLYRFVHQFPRLDLSAHVQPITRSMLKVDLIITPDFEFNKEIHGNSEGFWVLVEDVDCENILHYEFLMIKRRYADQEQYMTFTMPLFEPLAPLYYIRVLSDRWLHCENTLPVSFRQLILPQKNSPPTELLDLQPLYAVNTVSSHFCEKASKQTLREIMKSLSSGPSPWEFEKFNPIQTQVIPKLYEGNNNLLIASPPGSGKGVILDLALLDFLRKQKQPSNDINDHLCVFVTPKESTCSERYDDWNAKFGLQSYWGQSVVKLTGDPTADLKLLAIANILICTPKQWDVLSRRWKQRKRIQHVNLFIVDKLHFVGGGEHGPTMEVILSRMRYISAQVEGKEKKHQRIIGISNSVANAKDIGEWLGAGSDSIFNFHPNVRPLPLEIRVQGFEINDFSSRMLAMTKPVYNYIVSQSEHKPSIVFVPSVKQAQLSAIDLITFALADNQPLRFLEDKSGKFSVELPHPDEALEQTLNGGVAYCHEAMSQANQKYILSLYEQNKIQVLVVPHTMCWELRIPQTRAHSIVIMGTQFYDGKEHRYVDYQLSDVFQMTKFANRPLIDNASKCAVMCHSARKQFYSKFLYDPLPVESQLEHFLCDHFNAEIVTKTIESKQDAVDYLTWTLMYRRLSKNPNYYNIHGSSHTHISDHLSELVETTVELLEDSRCIQVENELDLTPMNLGMISAYYYVKYTTIELFARSLGSTSKIKSLLDILSSATEFADIPMRHGEERALERLAKHLRLPLTSTDYSQPHVKTNILLQVHFSRMHASLSAHLRADLDFILSQSIKLLHAIVDVISSNGWLRPALSAMDLSQMIVQAQWNNDSPLIQVPYFTPEIVKKIQKASEENDEEIETPLDILSMDDDLRQKLLPFDDSKMSQIAKFCNSYPDINIDMEVEDSDDISTGDSVLLRVNLEREVDEDENDEVIGVVNSVHYPTRKVENWWAVLGDPKSNTLLSIKRVPLHRNANIKLEFAAPETAGEYAYNLYVICDAYTGCDLENEVKINVQEGEDESSDESNDEE